MSTTQNERADVGRQAVKNLLSRGSFYAIGLGGQALASFVATPVLTHTLSKASFGLVAACLSLSQVVAVVATLGLPAPILRHFFHPEHGPTESGVLVKLGVVLAVLLGAVVYICGPLWIHIYSGINFEAPMKLAVATGALVAAGFCCDAHLKASDRSRLYVLSTLLRTPLGVLVGIGLTLRHPSATSYLTGMVIGAGLSVVVGLCAVAKARSRREYGAYFPAAFRLGLPALPHAAALYLLAGGDRVIVQDLLGIEATAQYQAAYQLGTTGLVLVLALNEAWAPILYKTDDGKIGDLLIDTIGVLSRIAIVISAASSLLAPLMLRIILPANYSVSQSAPVVGLVSLCLLPYLVYLAGMNLIFHKGTSWRLALSTPIVMVLGLGTSVAMTHWWGLIGAALASSLGYLILGTATWFSASLDFRHLIDLGKRSGLLGYLGAMTAVGIFLPTSPAMDLVRVPLAVVALVLTGIKLRGSLGSSATASTRS